MKRKLLSLFLLLGLVVFTNSCKPTVSLGGSVDILRPHDCKIIYPELGANPIRGSFIITGEASDDDAIASVSAVFENNETKAKTVVYNAELTPVGAGKVSWIIRVSNDSTGTREGHPLVKEYPIVDGEYTVIVTIKDKSGKSTVIDRSYKIDNTPPVFIVSRPSVVAGSDDRFSGDKYGAVFYVDGEAGEENTVEELGVEVPDSNINIVKKFVGKTIKVDISADGSSDGLYSLQAKDRNKNIQAKLFLADNSRLYSDGLPSGSGNKSGWYYLKDQIYADIMSKGFTAEVINDYFAGKKQSANKETDDLLKRLYDDNDAEAKLVRELLASKRIMMEGAEEKFSAFNLDPGKSPGFKVLNAKILAREFLDLGKVSNVLYSDTGAALLLLELIRNKDRTPLFSGFDLEIYKKSGLSVKLYRNKNADTVDINDQLKNLKEFKLENLEVAGSLNFADLTQSHLDNKVVQSDNGGLKIKYTLPQTEGLYLIKIEGKDVDGNDYAPYDENNSAMTGDYIFSLLSVGNGPRIRPIRPSGFKNKGFDFTLTITGLGNGDAYFKIGGEAGTSDTRLILDPTDTTRTKYKGTITDTVMQGLSHGNHTIHFYAVDKKGKFDRADTDFEVDNAAPKITVTNPDSNYPQAGKIKVTGTIFDEGIGVNELKTMYIIGKKSSVPTINTPLYSVTNDKNHWQRMTNSTPGSWSFEVDLSTIPSGQYGTSEGSYYRIPFYVLTEDKLGNKKVYEHNFLFDPDGKKPIITVLSPQTDSRLGGTIQIFGTANVAIGGPGDVGEVFIQFSKSGTFNSSADGSFGGTGSIPVTDWYNGGNGQAIPGTASGGANWRITINSDKAFDPTSGSSHDIYFRLMAKHKDGTTSGGWSLPVKITVDKDAPTIGSPNAVKVGTKDYLPNMWVKNNETLQGSLYDASGLKSVEIKSSELEGGINYDLNTAKTHGWITDVGGGNYELNIPFNFASLSADAVSAGTFSVTVRIVENTGHNLSAEQTFTFRFDKINPIGDYGKKKSLPGVGNFSATSFLNASLAAEIRPAPTKYKMLIKNTIVSVTGVSGNSIEFSPAITAGTYNYMVYEPVSLIYADMADNKWKIQGVANDDGAGVEKIEAWIEVNGTATAHTVIDDSYSDPANKIEISIAGQVIWEGGIKLDNVADGKGILKYKITDRSGNVYEGSKGDIEVKNKPVQIKKLVFRTDLSGNGSYEAEEIFTIENFGSLNDKRDFTGAADVAKFFTFKNPTESKLEVILEGGYGANATVSLNKDSINGVSIASGTPEITAGEYSVTLDLSGKLNIGDDPEKKLFLKVTDGAFNNPVGTPPWYAEANITVGLEVTDGTKPTGVIVPFFYNSDKTELIGEDIKLSSVKYESGSDGKLKPAGHIEISGISSLGAGVPCVSGKVIIRGIAYDNIRLKKLELSGAGIGGVNANFSNGSWTSSTGLNVKTSKFSNTGHYVEWEYEWATGTPALAETIKLKVTDAADKDNNLTANGEPNLKSGERSSTEDRALILAANDKAVVGQFIRLTDESERSYLVQINSVEGNKITWSNMNIPQAIKKYVLYKADSNNAELKVNIVPYIREITTKLNTAYSSNPSVFSRSATGAYSVRNDETITVHGFNLKAGSGNPAVSIGEIEGTPTANEIKVKLRDTGTTDKSGNFDVTVNGIKSINNLNSNAVYNMQPNGANNDLLNDDAKLHVWKFNKVNTDKGVRYPTMRVGKDSDQTVGFVYGSGAQSMKMNLNGQDFGIDYSFTQWYCTGVTVDNTGKIYGAAMNGDSGATGKQSNGGYANFGFYAWNTANNPGKVEYYNSTYHTYNYGNPKTHPQATMAYNAGYKKVALENANRETSFDSNRVVSPKIVTKGSGEVYTAYYDASAKQVKFRYGTVSGNPSNGTQLTFGGGLGNHNNASDGSASGAVEIDSGDTAGPYVAVGVVPTGAADAGTAVVAWYDPKNQRLMYKYSTSSSVYTSWSSAKEIDKDFVGWHVDLVVDKAGGVHIAYYSAQNGDLKYAYLSKYDAIPVVCSVDSFLSVGTNISIEVSDEKKSFIKYKVDENTGVVTEDGTEEKYVPYISYYMSSFTRTSNSVRVAYLAETKPIVQKKVVGGNVSYEIIADGVVNDKYTGTWEAMTIPTNEIPLDYTVGVGIKKNTANKNSVILGYGTTEGLETAILE